MPEETEVESSEQEEPALEDSAPDESEPDWSDVESAEVNDAVPELPSPEASEGEESIPALPPPAASGTKTSAIDVSHRSVLAPAAPSLAGPVIEVPDPDVTVSEPIEAEAGDSDATDCEASETETTESETAAPEAASPGAIEPDVTEAEASEVDATDLNALPPESPIPDETESEDVEHEEPVSGVDVEMGPSFAPPPPMVIIDLKGDPALFHTVRLEAEERRRQLGITDPRDPRYAFRFFTSEKGKATHHFNPFQSLESSSRSLIQICHLFLDSLSLSHGEGYGRSYYSRKNRHLLYEALEAEPRPRSFEARYERLAARAKRQDSTI